MMAYEYCLEKQFSVKFNPCTRTPQSWSVEVNNTAKSIAASTNKPLYVLMSGGIDSEMVARSFISNNIKFKALTLKHKQQTNYHDTWWADEFCSKHNISQEVLELDLYQFDDMIEKYITQGYKSTNIYHYMQLFLLEQLENLGGFGVGGAGEQIYYTIDNEIHLRINPSYTLGRQWCKNNNAWHQLWFSLDNPEIYASYLQIDIVDFLLQRPEYFKSHHGASTEKILVLHREWPEMKKRNKFSGFEKIQVQYRIPKENSLKMRFPELQDLCMPLTTVKSQLGIK
jgi:hypothetical protein